MTGLSEEIRCNAGQRDKERKYGRQSQNAQHSLVEERTEGTEDSQIQTVNGLPFSRTDGR